MQKINDFLRLIRLPNLIFIGILLWVMENWVAIPVLQQAYFDRQLPPYLLFLIILSTICIAMGGYVINDYFDIKIDRINRPNSFVVTNTFSKTFALRLGWISSGVGCVCGLLAAWLSHSWMLCVSFVITPGLLWFYSSSYKRQFLIGTLVIALLSATAPMLIAFANIGLLRYNYGELLDFSPLEHELYAWIGGFALFAFLCTMIREIIKDLQDQIGDRELECHTIPIRLGEKTTKIILTILILLTSILVVYIWYAVLPFPHIWKSLSTRYIYLGILTPLLCTLWLLWAARIPSDFRAIQQLMKFIMFLGVLYSFVIQRML